MGTPPKLRLSKDEIAAPFVGAWADRYPLFLSVQQVSELLGLSKKTIYEWIAKGRLDGSFRKRGKHCLFWRDRVIDLILNGKEWISE